jgi:hypothetical protein
MAIGPVAIVAGASDAENREMVASLILYGINRNNGIFPEKNTFIERG